MDATRADMPLLQDTAPPKDTTVAPMDSGMDTAPVEDSAPAEASMDSAPEVAEDSAPEAAVDTTIRCPEGQLLCGGACVDPMGDRANCGACGNACTAPERGLAACMMARCVVACEAGFMLRDGRCMMVMLPPPRLVSPPWGSRVTSQRPRFRVALSEGTDGAAFELCEDRACARVRAMFTSTGPEGSPAMDLAPGAYFWRARGRMGEATVTGPSAVWVFFVGRRSAAVNTAWGVAADVNGDACGDVLVGAHLDSRAVIHQGASTGLGATASATLSIPEPDAEYGFSVAGLGDIDGDGYGDVAIGSPGFQQVYVYRGSATGVATGASPIVLRGPAMSRFGHAVNGAGDVNRDGYADLVVGAPSAQRAFVFYGRAAGFDTTPSVTLEPPSEARRYGYSAATAGDVNADGFADVVVGTYGADRAYVYLGSATGLGTTGVELRGPAMSEFGKAVGGADVNGDGYSDVLATTFQTNILYVYNGGMSGVPMMPNATIRGPEGNNDYGDTVADLGDVNLDGFTDVGVGAPLEDQVFVYQGGASGLATMATPVLSGPEGGAFGHALSGAGDVNCDGVPEFVVGASEVNRAMVYTGSMTGVVTMPMISLDGSRGGFGAAVACVTPRWTWRRPGRS